MMLNTIFLDKYFFKYFKILLGYLFLFNFLDLISTYYFLSKGGLEGNPNIVYLFKTYGFAFGGILKIYFSVVIMFFYFIFIKLIYKKIKHKHLLTFILITILSLNYFYGFIVIYNIIYGGLLK